MGKLPQISGVALVRALKRDGWQEMSQKGSHLKLIKHLKPIGTARVIVPMHRVLKKGTLHGILKDAALSREKLLRLL
ncbi:hypothetical protein A3A64_04630 [Candidatus Gottesmanbacteria bacterium RIFCSPLOWO2_01_FULL_48_11]|uniref:Ycfa-like protein n=2 Tax=Candidatus Gottesmaniibacteriota TaxID=1752720 RepID=A0A0G1XNQ8_9BACT|nr:MAG: Ycfa-like protein [Candidatus Gottesmanbacteria bacterium GW2011_GWA1_48_13]OGG27794.1 MAG: hypothetical protein A3A64_04630 [Candidatus Gottesmanbacteria bacterium RIFCSPLOWO2_01_FULL_48_11]